jgi:hypothetical protein
MKRFVPKDIDRLAEREDFGGYGFIGTVEHLPKKAQQKARTAVCRAATELGFTDDQFFEWLNSKPGRHFCDNDCMDTPKTLKKQALISMRWMLKSIEEGSWYAPVRIF